MVSVLLFFVTARYRLPVVPILILFAVQYVLWALERVRSGRHRPVLLSLAAVLLLLPAVNRGFSDADRIYGPEEDRYLGFYFQSQGRPAEAEEAYRRALGRDSTYADVQAELGQLILEQGRADEAFAHLERAHRILPFAARTRHLLGLGHAALGRANEAEACFRDALEVEPSAEISQELGILLLGQDRLEDAEEFLLEARRLMPYDVNAWYRLSECYYRQGDYEKAEDALVGAMRLAPEDRNIERNLRDLRRLRMQSESR
jgi:tetratricopeptide (TPR) repeat protein